MPRKSSIPGIFLTSTGWTGKATAWTIGNQALHAEIAKEQVTHFKMVDTEGYWESLLNKAQKHRYGSLEDEGELEIE